MQPEQMPTTFSRRKSRSVVRVLLKTVAVCVFVGAVSLSIFFFWKYQSAEKDLAALRGQNSGSEQEAKRLAEIVGRKIMVPEGVPTLATVSDSTKLSDQVSFKNAQNGDRVLIYTQAQKAYLYRPSTDQLVDVITLSVGQPSVDSASKVASDSAEGIAVNAAAAAAAAVSLTLYNGTTTAGLTTRYEPTLATAYPAATVSLKENAAKNDYATSFVVDVSAGQNPAVLNMAEALGLPVESLPEGETTPSTDALIILGQDQL